MTLEELIRDARQWLQEEQNTPGGGSPFGWPGLIVQAADLICLETDCLMQVYRAARDGSGLPTLPRGVRLCRRGWQPFLNSGDFCAVGFRTPGEEWELGTSPSGAEVPVPLNGDSVCPLPFWAQAAVAIKAAQLRCVQFPTPENAARVPLLQAEYGRRLGEIEARAGREYRALWAAYPNFPDAQVQLLRGVP